MIKSSYRLLVYCTLRTIVVFVKSTGIVESFEIGFFVKIKSGCICNTVVCVVFPENFQVLFACVSF